MAFIRWQKDEYGASWLDYIPANWPSKAGRSDNQRHLSLRNGKPITCFCDVVVDDRRMVIFYDGKHTAANEKFFFPGRTYISFDDDERTLFRRHVDWHADGTIYHEAAEVEIEGGTPEGAERVQRHKKRERSGTLPWLKKEQTLAETGKLACEACVFDFLESYGELGFGFCEVHHNEKIAGGERMSTLDDLAIVCANCHRMIHKSERDGEMLTIEELKSIVLKRPEQSP